jgi:lysophospholipase L1-like esterase
MKKIVYGALVLLIIISTLYLNRSYAFIYQNIKTANMQIPSDYKEYSIGSSSKSLTYIAIGDSLTSGIGVETYKDSYPYLLAELISQKENLTIKLIPVSTPGIRSEHILNMLTNKVFEQSPDIITLLIGVNDVHGNISSSEFENNYKAILEKITKQSNSKVYAIAIPYIGTPDLITLPYRQYFMSRTTKFNSIIESLAKEYNVEYVDLYELSLGQYRDSSSYSVDLFHLNKKGYTEWAKHIYANFNK